MLKIIGGSFLWSAPAVRGHISEQTWKRRTMQARLKLNRSSYLIAFVQDQQLLSTDATGLINVAEAGEITIKPRGRAYQDNQYKTASSH